MKRWVYAYRYVAGTPEALEHTLLERSIDLLRAATASPRSEPAADGSYLMELHSTVAGIEIAKSVRVKIGVAYRAGSRAILPITWRAAPAKHAFPTFSGTLELEALDAHSAELSLVGSYQAPLGPLGAAADAVLLRNVGQSTTEGIVRALAVELFNAVGAPPAREHVTGPRFGEPLRVRDVMTEEPLVIDENLPLRTAALMLFQAVVSGAPVVSANGALVGVISEADLLAKEATRDYGLDRKALEEDRRRRGRTAGEAGTRPALTTVPDAKLAEVSRTMLDEEVNRLVVVDQGRVAGIISRHDVLAALVREDSEIELAAQKVAEAHAGSDIEVAVQWGEVTLRGDDILPPLAHI